MKFQILTLIAGTFLPAIGFCTNPPWEKVGHYLCTTEDDSIYSPTFVMSVIEPSDSKIYQAINHFASYETTNESLPQECARKTRMVGKALENGGDDCLFSSSDSDLQVHLSLNGEILGSYNDESPSVLSFAKVNAPGLEIWVNGAKALEGKIQHMCRRFVGNAYKNEVLVEYVDSASQETRWVMFLKLNEGTPSLSLRTTFSAR